MCDRKQCGRERGGEIGKGPQAEIRTRDARRVTALYIGALPTGLQALTKKRIFEIILPTPKF